MKFFQVLVLIIGFNCIFSDTIRRNRNTPATVKSNTKLFHFAIGVVQTLANKGESEVKKCLPSSLQPGGIDDPSAILAFSSYKALNEIVAIKKYAGIALNLACKQPKRIKEGLRSLLHNRRLFVSVKKTMSSKRLLNVIPVVESLVKWFKSIKEKITGFFNSALTQKSIKFIQCLRKTKNTKDPLTGYVNNFTNAAKKVLSGWKGIISVLVKCICNYASFIKGIDFLTIAMHVSGNERWDNLGRFFGQLVLTISGK